MKPAPLGSPGCRLSVPPAKLPLNYFSLLYHALAYFSLLQLTLAYFRLRLTLAYFSLLQHTLVYFGLL